MSATAEWRSYWGNQMTREDIAVTGAVLAALASTGIPMNIDEPLPLTEDRGPHRLYQWEVITRDDEPFNDTVFRKKLAAINRMMKYYKPQLYSVEEYPAEQSNFHRSYLTVYV